MISVRRVLRRGNDKRPMARGHGADRAHRDWDHPADEGVCKRDDASQAYPRNNSSTVRVSRRQCDDRENGQGRIHRGWRKLVCVELFVVIILLAQTGVAAARIAVFPIRGSRYNRPHTQVTFRGIPAAEIGSPSPPT